MLVNKRLFFGVVLLVVSSVTVFAAVEVTYSFSPEGQLAHCHEFTYDNQQVDCIYREINNHLHTGGMRDAFAIFNAAYERFESFAGSGCHRHAHRVGDMVYYEVFLRGIDSLKGLNFPQETTACGYGFFHGFLEHLIQDNPDPVFVRETCEHLVGTLGDHMGDISIICYHGSGHGFMLHHAEQVSRDAWGDIVAFTEEPLLQCDGLLHARESEREECRQGVFNVIVDWMEDTEYGFSYNHDDPFVACHIFDSKYHYGCYYEMAQKLPAVYGYDARLIAEGVQHVGDDVLRNVAFRIGVAGIIQQSIISGHGYEETLTQCAALHGDMFELCTSSLLLGLFEHGTPREEYKAPLVLCDEDVVRDLGFRNGCYGRVAGRLLRFYTPENIIDICTEFPSEFEAMCLRKNGL